MKQHTFIFFQKKKALYIISMFSIVLMCLSAPLAAESGGVVHSVLDAMQDFSASRRAVFSIKGVFAAGVSSFWFYLVMPLAASIPVASYISDEWKCGFHQFEIMRAGSFAYMRTRLFYLLGSNAVILLAGMGIYLLAVCCYFHLYPDYMTEVERAGGAWDLACSVAVRFEYLFLYSAAISLFIMILVRLYNDLFFDLSAAFVLNYLLRNWVMGESVIYPLVLFFVMLALYVITWKKGKKV